ncbi:MAG: hypothetical protein CMJ32_05540 [Phycisphaerae bacterium]|nr:hypothetical protein [Phycisphaerae bacterium]
MKLPTLLITLLLAIQASTDGTRAPDTAFELTELPGKVVIRQNGRPFTEYRWGTSPRPYFFPVLTPSGSHLTRGFPMETMPGESKDHRHHQSIWFGHGDVNGYDFWSNSQGNRIEHQEVMSRTSTPEESILEVVNNWNTHDGKTLLVEKRRMVFRSEGSRRSIDLEFELLPVGESVTFGDTKEGTMAIRVAPTLRLKGASASGSIHASEGHDDEKAWGSRNRWVAYSGPVGSETATISIFDHPSNPRHPTWWHARDYGLFAANPFGIHDFEKKPPGTGDLVLEPGSTLKLKYRIELDTAKADPDAINSRWKRWSARKTQGS